MAASTDLEHGLEFERIKENYRLTTIAPEVTANVPEMQTAFQELQTELREFLGQYLPKVTSLQASIAGHVQAEARFANQGAASSRTHHPPASQGHSQQHTSEIHAISDQMTCQAISRVPSVNVGVARAADLLDAHVANLNNFLNAHAENLRLLQNALTLKPEGGTYRGAPNNVHSEPQPPAQNYDALTEQFNMLVVISTFTAGLIVSYLSLVDGIIGTNHRTAFSVGMLFSFFAMLMHFGNIIVAGRGAALTSQALDNEERDFAFFKFYLSVCEQLQFAATLLFILSIIILSFYLFISIAFPLVLLVCGLVCALVVFWSTYWKVSITFRNLTFLVKNFRRLRWKSVAYLKAHTSNARRAKHAT